MKTKLFVIFYIFFLICRVYHRLCLKYSSRGRKGNDEEILSMVFEILSKRIFFFHLQETDPSPILQQHRHHPSNRKIFVSNLSKAASMFKSKKILLGKIYDRKRIKLGSQGYHLRVVPTWGREKLQGYKRERDSNGTPSIFEDKAQAQKHISITFWYRRGLAH